MCILHKSTECASQKQKLTSTVVVIRPHSFSFASQSKLQLKNENCRTYLPPVHQQKISTSKPRVKATITVASHGGVLKFGALQARTSAPLGEPKATAVLFLADKPSTKQNHDTGVRIRYLLRMRTNHWQENAMQESSPSVFPPRMQLEGPQFYSSFALAANHWLFVYPSSWSVGIDGVMSGTGKSCSDSHKRLVVVYRNAATLPWFESLPRFRSEADASGFIYLSCHCCLPVRPLRCFRCHCNSKPSVNKS
jgi:hypothetical protein